MKKNSFLGVSEEGFHNIAYTEWGSWSPELPTVICVHGYTRNGRDFDALAHYLGIGGRHIFCPDVVGRGDSSWFKQAHHYNFNQYVADMNALIARTRAQQIDWIGTSMGGIIGMMLASLPHSPVRRLILNDVGPQIPLQGLRKLAKYIGNDPEFKSMEEAKKHFKKNYSEFGKLSEKQWDDFTAHSVEKRAAKVFVAKVDPAIRNPKSTMQIVSDFFHHPQKALEGILYDIDLWSVWSKIRCPVLVIHGVHSELLTPEIIKKMRRTHTQTEVYEIADAGHAPALLEVSDHEIIDSWLNSKKLS
ncbi:alpha/beta hydrolase [Legionella antarctica]|uniref:Alpha/beta hydrolase n=1 Tax=Legionella antarctica TaxID=2708020 RepID=A0A6F8T4A3_9GAMM|nr:alpha/beta hydrolase [Legionella antarctica]BCA94796.1 alpha/beta hydrolase [Legionella antarctica]